MLRFVVGPEQSLVFDAAATLPGRGLWLSAKADVLESSVKRGLFARAAKQAVRLPPELRALVASSLQARITDLVGLARRGGNAIAGFEKAREWLVAGKVGLVVQASDGSADECRRFLGGREIPVVMPLNALRLGQVFGREMAVHVVIAGGKLARMIEIDSGRLAGVAGSGTSGQ
jgi:predicted RNA-binding protein YlxR (DUF448 family)